MHSKKGLTERDICTKYITPAVEKAGINIKPNYFQDILVPLKTLDEKVNSLMAPYDSLEQEVKLGKVELKMLKGVVRDVVDN